MKVVALTRTSSIGPSTRYRIEQYIPALADAGIEVTTHPLFGETWFAILERPAGPLRTLLKAGYSVARLFARVGQVLAARASDADVILVEQQLFPYLPAALELLLWPRRQPTIVEFDDAIYLTAGHGTKLPRLWSRARLVIVGNRFLEEQAARHAEHVAVIPTTVDTARYASAQQIQQRRRREALDQPGPLRVGWVGLRYNFPFLEELAGPVAGLPDGGELRVISSGLPEGPAFDGLTLVERPWSEATEADEIGDCDVGVMPLPDTPWARGKCALKLLQYMAAGVPVVASPVGVNADIVKDGENGLLASTPAQWAQALEALAADPGLRARLGDAGRATVEAGFSLPGGAEAVAKAYGFAAGRADGGITAVSAPTHPPR
jgi:glycosyltransferase involved in cell wall biosynthesis